MNFKQKARIALSAIAVLTIVGGAYAFTARQSQFLFASDPANGICSLRINGVSLDPSPTPYFFNVTDQKLTTTCPAIQYFSAP